LNTPGELGTAMDARAMAMGGAGLALLDGTNVNLLNPSVAATYDKTAFKLSFERNYTDYRVPYGKSVNISYDLPQVVVGVPFYWNSALFIGLTERYDQNYLVTAPLYEGGNRVGVRRIVGEGAVYAISGGGATRFGDKLYVGAVGHYHFGAPKILYQHDYYVKGYSDTEETIETSYRGFAIGAGIGYRLTDKVHVGGYFEIPHKLSVKVETYNEFGTIEESNHKFSMPARGGIGTVYRRSDRWCVAGDIGYVGWGSFRVDGRDVLPTRNVLSVHAGLEFRPITEKGGFFLFKQPYRAGFFRRPWYDETRGAMAETGFSTGFGYLFRDNNESRVDFTFEYAKRGGLEESGVEETIYNMYLSIIGIEPWIGKMAEED
jgi:opacity protein-like surface antigen